MTSAPDSGVSVAHPVLKVVTVWLAALGITSWGEFAAMCAAVYSMLLILEWCWKKFVRDLLVKWKLIDRCKRRRDDK